MLLNYENVEIPQKRKFSDVTILSKNKFVPLVVLPKESVFHIVNFRIVINYIKVYSIGVQHLIRINRKRNSKSN